MLAVGLGDVEKLDVCGVALNVLLEELQIVLHGWGSNHKPRIQNDPKKVRVVNSKAQKQQTTRV